MNLRGRAAKVLDVPDGAAASDVRAAFVTRLSAEGFVPPEECLWAANTLGYTTLPLSSSAKAEAASIEREAVDAFVEQFWTLPPDSRTARWKELKNSTTDSATVARLDALEAGLDIEVKRHENPLVEEVAEVSRELFVLGPRARLVRQSVWLGENALRRADLNDAARRLRTDEPQLGRLIPTLHIELARREAFLPILSVDPQVVQAELEQRNRQVAAELERAVSQQYSASASPSTSGCGGWSVYLIVALVLFGARACISSTNRSENPVPRQNYSFPQTTPPSIKLDLTERFTRSEIFYFLEYERQLRIGNKLATPHPRYQRWLKAGRPAEGTDDTKGPR